MNKEIIIRDKIHIVNIILLIALFIMSIIGFVVFFNANENKVIGMIIWEILFAGSFILLLPYLTFKRPYLKLKSNGIYYKRPHGFELYGKEKLIAWNRIDAIIDSDSVFIIQEKEIQKSELNAESISKLDKFNEISTEDFEAEAEWLENGIYIVTKKEKDYEPEIYEIGSFLSNPQSNIETIKKMWCKFNNIIETKKDS